MFHCSFHVFYFPSKFWLTVKWIWFSFFVCVCLRTSRKVYSFVQRKMAKEDLWLKHTWILTMASKAFFLVQQRTWYFATSPGYGEGKIVWGPLVAHYFSIYKIIFVRRPLFYIYLSIYIFFAQFSVKAERGWVKTRSPTFSLLISPSYLESARISRDCISAAEVILNLKKIVHLAEFTIFFCILNKETYLFSSISEIVTCKIFTISDVTY